MHRFGLFSILCLSLLACGLPEEGTNTGGPSGEGGGSAGAAVCGNGVVELAEDCDDGNGVDGDGCDSTCTESARGPGDETDFGLPEAQVLTIAEVNEFTGLACAEADAGLGAIQLVSAEVDAAQVILLPSDRTQVVQLPESGTGYFTLEVPAWGAKMIVSTPYTTNYEIIEGDREVARRWNGTCGAEGVVQEGYVFHRWGAFTVRVTDENNERVPFTIVHTNPE